MPAECNIIINSQAPTRYLRTLAKVPPMILDKRERTLVRFVDNNGLIEDAMLMERERKMTNPWTEQEKQIFLEKYVTCFR